MAMRLGISVEGQTEEDFVHNVLSPWLKNNGNNIESVTPCLIRGKKTRRGGGILFFHGWGMILIELFIILIMLQHFMIFMGLKMWMV